MRSALGAALFTALFTALLGAGAARAQGKDDEEEEEEEDIVVVGDDKPSVKKGKDEFKKQDLRGHAVDAGSAKNVFEKDRFFVDKVDSKKTAKGTLVQGSLASSSFLYTETSGPLGAGVGDALGDAGSKFSRLFTELRLQTDFRHIGGGKWDARIDTRGRFVTTPDNEPTTVMGSTTPRVQSGFNGTNEYEVREAWIVRSGKRSDLFLGRQFIPDLGALRIDGLRVDYAQSQKLTYIMFGGLYPIRGSRSLTTDYQPLKDDNGNAAGRFVGSGGFGVAYRTLNAHGAFGGVAIAPLKAETPRIYVTSNGYYRSGAKVDLYHYAILDVFGKAAPALTNLSVGANYKPSQRLRATASFNRVDTETLNVQANAFLSEPNTATGTPVGQTMIRGAGTRVQNETFLSRLSTNSGRVGLSAGLGSLQRFEVSTAVSYRYRPAFTLRSGDGMTAVNLDAAKGVDVSFGIADRRSIANLRLGADVTKSLALGNIGFQRSEVLAIRVLAARELKSGRGEWEGELSYSQSKDVAGGITCGITTVEQCFGSSSGSVISLGGNLFYRINRDWFALGNLYVSRYSVTAATGADPGIFGITGFARIAYRF